MPPPETTTKPPFSSPLRGGTEGWKSELAGAIRSGEELIDILALPESLREGARRSAEGFPVVVPRSYLARMEVGNPRDPLVLQVLP
ncbi:MAG: hypothetical protein KDA68_19090, partial [Planctomycetaceae bacterium]|nr:hypothetical protein [Planctomycetaceae bacterium]